MNHLDRFTEGVEWGIGHGKGEQLFEPGGHRGGLGNLNTGDKWYFCSQSAFVDGAGGGAE